jgi:hypothetical protein
MLKGQDIVLLILLRLQPGQSWNYQSLSHELGLSTSQCHQAIQRIRSAGLLSLDKADPWHVPEANCLELILHGVKYFFPPEIGSQARGIPTAGSAPFIQKHFTPNKANTSAYVWPDPEGNLSGSSISPIHPCQLRFAPGKNKASSFDTRLYEAMACIDLLRVGRARERAWAAEELKKRLHVDK